MIPDLPKTVFSGFCTNKQIKGATQEERQYINSGTHEANYIISAANINRGVEKASFFLAKTVTE